MTPTQTVIILALQVVSQALARETYCPPPVRRFLRINDKIYRRMNGAVIHLNEVAGEEVVRLRLKPNPYYSSPKCGVLETKNGHGFSHFGVREEYDLENFQKAEECQVYLARTGVGRLGVKLSVMVTADVVAGLSTECQPQLSVRVSFTVKFCAAEWSCEEDEEVDEDEEGEWEEDEGDYDIETEYVTGCDSEWGCEAADTVETEDPGCPGEWGCVFDSRTAVVVTPGVSVISEAGHVEEDFLSEVFSTLMSEEMMPVTISCLLVLALLLLLAMWCLVCRNSPCCRCCRRSKVGQPERTISLTSTATTLDSGRTDRQTRELSRENSSRSIRSAGSVRTLNDDDFSVYSGFPDDDKDFAHEEILVAGKRKLFTVSEERDPTEDGLESLEWDNKSYSTPTSTSTPTKVDAKKTKGTLKKPQRDIPVTFYL